MLVKYKQSLLDIETHALINRGKRILYEKYGKKFSVAETIRYYMRGTITLDMLPKSVSAYLTEFVAHISLDNRILGITLFGSYSRLENSKYSDIDLFIVFDGKKMEAFNLLFSVLDLLGKYRDEMSLVGIYSDISPFIVPLSDLNLFRPIYFNILGDGIVLFQRGPAIEDFKKLIMNKKVKRFIVDSSEVISWTP